jgi:hypothetical protein
MESNTTDACGGLRFWVSGEAIYLKSMEAWGVRRPGGLKRQDFAWRGRRQEAWRYRRPGEAGGLKRRHTRKVVSLS